MRIAKTVFKIQHLLKDKLQAQKHYLLAVSGGADSLALAHAASELQAAGYARFSVCHVEHGLRGEEALQDMQLVEKFCEHFKLPCYVQHVDVRRLMQTEHLSVEDAARRLRYGALRNAAKNIRAAAIVTAHHEGDQAETLLLRLLRGAGIDGLAAMSESSGDILRPFLEVSRAMLEEYCELNKLRYCHDSTNDDTAYTRNRVRLELLPYLERAFNAEIKPALARTAKLLAQDADCLDKMSSDLYAQMAAKQADAISFLVLPLLTLHPALMIRLLRRAYFELGGEELSYERSQALVNLCAKRTGGKFIQLPQGINAVYKNKRIVFTKNV